MRKKRARYVSLRFRCCAATARLHRVDRSIDAEDRRVRAAGYAAAARRRRLAMLRSCRKFQADEGTPNIDFPMYETLSGRRIQATECAWVAPFPDYREPISTLRGLVPPLPRGRRSAMPR